MNVDVMFISDLAIQLPNGNGFLMTICYVFHTIRLGDRKTHVDFNQTDIWERRNTGSRQGLIIKTESRRAESKPLPVGYSPGLPESPGAGGSPKRANHDLKLDLRGDNSSVQVCRALEIRRCEGCEILGDGSMGCAIQPAGGHEFGKQIRYSYPTWAQLKAAAGKKEIPVLLEPTETFQLRSPPCFSRPPRAPPPTRQPRWGRRGCDPGPHQLRGTIGAGTPQGGFLDLAFPSEGASLLFARSPPANKVIKTRYRIVKKNVGFPSSSFSSPVPSWKTRRLGTSRGNILGKKSLLCSARAVIHALGRPKELEDALGCPLPLAHPARVDIRVVSSKSAFLRLHAVFQGLTAFLPEKDEVLQLGGLPVEYRGVVLWHHPNFYPLIHEPDSKTQRHAECRLDIVSDLLFCPITRSAAREGSDLLAFNFIFSLLTWRSAIAWNSCRDIFSVARRGPSCSTRRNRDGGVTAAFAGPGNVFSPSTVPSLDEMLLLASSVACGAKIVPALPRWGVQDQTSPPASPPRISELLVLVPAGGAALLLEGPAAVIELYFGGTNENKIKAGLRARKSRNRDLVFGEILWVHRMLDLQRFILRTERRQLSEKKQTGYPEQGGLRGLKVEDFELRVSSFGSGPDRVAQENHKGSRGASTLIFSGAGTLRWASTCIFLSVGFWEAPALSRGQMLPAAGLPRAVRPPRDPGKGEGEEVFAGARRSLRLAGARAWFVAD
ncbi:hypothetical protein Anapl_14008 [Anas platyrhynchos]|uniref:Uncharacterized protein n=1 Tax=Anas platyrhynchos TaxID=8839 RepID=R0JDW0_ANAPL|nr:hypothetical protein Anapl_14008 [Anas platyrhynchos]